MEQEVKIIKWLFGCGVSLLVLALVVNLNSELGLISFECPLISNGLVLTLVGGIYTGVTAVLLEKLYKYRLDKRNIVKSMYYDAFMLYAEIQYWIRNISELDGDKEMATPENLFSNKLPMVNGYLYRLRCYDYSNFFKRDRVKTALETFQLEDSNVIGGVFSSMNYYEIAVIRSKIHETETGNRTKAEIYQVMAIFEKKLLACEEMVEKLVRELSEADKKLDWDKDKANILGAYQGVYCREIEEFIKENEGSNVNVD